VGDKNFFSKKQRVKQTLRKHNGKKGGLSSLRTRKRAEGKLGGVTKVPVGGCDPRCLGANKKV